MSSKAKRVALYMRVSTEEQARHGDSIEAQRQALRQYAETHNLNVIGEYADEGISGQKPVRKRPALSEMLQEVEADRVDLILFTKLDRWFRSVKLYYQAQEVLDAHKTAWRAILEDYNTETADGTLKVNIMLSVAQNEAERTSERIKFVFADKVRRGEPITGSLPIGYRIETVDGRKRVAKDPEKEEMVNDIIQTYLRTQSLRRTTIEINRKYEQHMDLITVKNLLRNEMIAGRYRDNEVYCEPYITSEEYEKIQGLWQNNIKFNAKEAYYFSSLIICPECGNKMSGFRGITKRGQKQYRYKKYRCSKSYKNNICSFRRTTSENVLEQMLLSQVEDDMEHVRSKAMHAKESCQSVQIERRREEIRQEMERISYVFTKGRMEPEEYDRRYDALERELAELKKPEKPDVPKPLPKGWRQMYDDLDAAGKQQFWRRIVREIHITKWDRGPREIEVIFLSDL